MDALFIKVPSTVFARHVLATAKQQAGQTMHDFLQTLRALSKDCNFQAATAEDYRQQKIRDAFVNGLTSSAIRQRLLEDWNLTLNQAYDQANALDCALRQPLAYDGTSNANVVAVAPKSPSKAQIKRLITLLRPLFLQFRADRRPKIIKKLRASFVEILQIIQDNGVQHGTLFVLMVEGRAIFRRFVGVKRKQIQRLRHSINRYL